MWDATSASPDGGIGLRPRPRADRGQKHAKDQREAGVAGASPVNIRIRVPLPFKPLYLTILGGPERRHVDRLRNERYGTQFRSAGNLAFMVATGLAFYLVAAMALLLYSSVFEF
jgi:hypothetical protein